MLGATAYRPKISSKLKDLRTSRRWTQVELAKKLGISQNWLSEIERGNGSLTAEQFLEVLRLFNVTTNHFTGGSSSHATELQRSLARFGATHLYASDRGIPSEELDEVHRAIVEAIVDGSPRILTALAPVLVQNLPRINIARLVLRLTDLGLQPRLYWVFDNVLDAIEIVAADDPALVATLPYRRAVTALSELRRITKPLSAAAPDFLDQIVASPETLDEVTRERSALSERWSIITSIQPADFADALRDAR